MHHWPNKDPDEELDYQFNWSARLEEGETLTDSEFILESGDVTLALPGTIAGGLTTIWISGGTAGITSVVTNRVVTSDGRTYDESARLRVRSSA